MLAQSDWDALAAFAAQPFAPGWPDDQYTFFSPVDRVHEVILAVVRSASISLMGNHYGFDDDEVSAAMLAKFKDAQLACMLNLDSSQAAGTHEKVLLESWASYVGNSVAIGQSAKSAISHLKVTVIDGLYVISGSTNLSLSGEQKQDNELAVRRNPLLAARYAGIIMHNHLTMLNQMAAKAPA